MRPKNCGEYDNYPELKRAAEMTKEEREECKRRAIKAVEKLSADFNIDLKIEGINK